MEKCKKCAPKAIWWATQNSHCMQKSVLKIKYFERGLLKTLTNRGGL